MNTEEEVQRKNKVVDGGNEHHEENLREPLKKKRKGCGKGRKTRTANGSMKAKEIYER